MKLWILTRKDSVGYEEYDSFIVLAQDESEARKLAHDQASYSFEDWSVWLDTNLCSCEQLTRKGKKAKIILGSYNGG